MEAGRKLKPSRELKFSENWRILAWMGEKVSTLAITSRLGCHCSAIEEGLSCPIWAMPRALEGPGSWKTISLVS